MAADTVFVLLYVGAVEGSGRFLAPKQIYRMTDAQARRLGDEDRLGYARESLTPGFSPRGSRWYADNTREPIRDETLRDGLVVIGAVVVRRDIATTSSLPRYALKASFAALFDPALTGVDLEMAIDAWRRANLSAPALTRVALAAQGIAATRAGVLVTFPDGETRRMAAGVSSEIAKAVLEVFARRFLIEAAVVLLSESQAKIVKRDESLISRLRLRIDPGGTPLLVFVEIVATDGAITAERKQALLGIATEAGFDERHVAFVTAYKDRGSTGFKKTVSRLAWGSFAWFVTEPDHLLVQYEGVADRARLAELLGPSGPGP